MHLNEEAMNTFYQTYSGQLIKIATRTAPEDEVQYIGVVARCLALYLYDCDDIDEKELTSVAKKVWNTIRIENGNTMENFTTCVFRELCFWIYFARRNIKTYSALVQGTNFWRKWIMS